jgi:hypothetical protein
MNVPIVSTSASWRGSLEDLGYQIEILKGPAVRSHLLCVAIDGAYWHPGRCSEGSGLIEMIVAAALANPHGAGQALVCDLAKLSYSGGDSLLDWRTLPARFSLSAYSVAAVSSSQNESSIRSLIEYLDDSALADILHPTRSAAISSVLNRRLWDPQ